VADEHQDGEREKGDRFILEKGDRFIFGKTGETGSSAGK
jgi:hypothetical protein